MENDNGKEEHMKEVVKTMLEHPIASIFLIGAIGNAVSMIVHGNKPLIVRVSKTEAKTEA